jgi:hypothetical protein
MTGILIACSAVRNVLTFFGVVIAWWPRRAEEEIALIAKAKEELAK